MIIDPNLLQLVGLGIEGDPYLLDGRHLRWFFGRMLGFPRSGFRLRRRPSARDFEGLIDFIRRQSLTQKALSDPLTPGVRIDKRKGRVFQTAFPNDGPALRVDEQPVWIDFENGLPPTPEAADPAAYVMLVFARRSSSGVVEATGWYDTRGAAVPRYRSIDSASASSGGGKPTGTNPWVHGTLVLHGGLLDRVEITGRDAVLLEVRWLPTAHYADAPDWEDIGRFYLPFTSDPGIYPAWSPDDGVTIAKQRLDEAPPQARAPWDEPNHPPPPLDAATAAEIWADLMARHLEGTAFDVTYEAMKLFLEGELVQIVPQALVEFEVQLEPESPAAGEEPDEEEPAQITVRPFDTLYAGAVDPARARLLGLLTTDFKEPNDPGVAWDYTIDADYPELWIRWMTDPEGAAAEAARLRKKFGSKPLPWQDLELVPRQQVLSMATCIERGKVPLPAPPPDLTVDLVPRPLGQPIQTDAALSWLATERNFFEAPDEVRIAFAVRRLVEGEDVAMHPLDPDLLEQGRRAPVPHLPTAESVERYAGRCRVLDSTLERYNLHEWRVSGMDLFGRFSPFATVQEKVVDLIAPPVPPAVRAALEGDGPSWKLVAEWEWPAEMAALAPDLSRFEIHLRQGAVSPADARLPGTWGRFEHVANATTLPLSVSLAGTVTPPGSGLTATATATPDGATTRLRLQVSPVARAFDAQGHATVSVAVTAADWSGNVSPFGDAAIARRLSTKVPVVPPFTGDLVYTSLPDAARRCRYRVAIPELDGGTAQVLRAPEATLRAAAGLDAATWNALPEAQRVGRLQQAAVAHRELFSPDHAFPYDERTAEHMVEISGAERSWTAVTVVNTGRTGTPAAWPSDPHRFAVVAVARPVVPPRPEILEVRTGHERVAFSLRPDDSGITAEVRLYRARTPDQVADVRRMRPVLNVTISGGATPMVLEEVDLHADLDYWYRLVAVAADGTCSDPTEPVRIRLTGTAPPRPGEVLAVTRTPMDPAARKVSFRLPRRDYSVYLFRRGLADPWAKVAQIGALAPDGTVRLADLTPAPHNGGWRYDVTDTVPDPDGIYRYHVRVIDPRDRISDSPSLMEAVEEA